MVYSPITLCENPEGAILGGEKRDIREAKNVLNRLSRLVAGILIAGSLTALVWAQAAPAWKDQGESDIGLAAGNEKDPAKQLDLLKKWEQQYPDSALKDQRTLMTAQALLADAGCGLRQDAIPRSSTAGQKAGQQLEDHFSDYFADSVKPARPLPHSGPPLRKTPSCRSTCSSPTSPRLRRTMPAAEAELKKVLGVDPTQASASYQLGSIIMHEMAVSKDLSRYSEALYDLARSLAVTGPNALPAAVEDRRPTAALKKNYGNYHGSSDGLDDLIKTGSASALPPAGFHIESVVEIQAAKEKDHAAWAAAHPDLDFWENIKTALTTQGDAYFANLKDVGFPPPAERRVQRTRDVHGQSGFAARSQADSRQRG